MKSASPSEQLKQLASISVDLLKDQVAKGQELSADTLSSALESNEAVQNLFKNAATVNPPAKTVEKLKSQVKAYQTQKSQLVKQIDGIEESRKRDRDFFKRVFSLLAGLMHHQKGSAFGTLLQDFQKVIKEDAPIATLEETYQKLREAALRKELSASGPDARKEKQGSFFSRLFTGPTDPPPPGEENLPGSHLEQIKDAYRAILNELRLNLGNDQLDSITAIDQRINQSDSLEGLGFVRDSILNLLQNFINTIYSERVLAAGFINEISQRLVAVENHILRSLDQTGKILSANREYNLKLGEHLGALRNSVEYSKTLADLKNAVVSKLDVIGQVMEAKNKENTLQENDADERLQQLQKNLNEMKNKVSSAEEHAKTLEKELLVDPLTGAYNRRAYDNKVEEEMERFLRYQNIFSLLLFDVDHFKKINDTYGHAVGDKCLKEIIARIKPAIRKVDFLARYGGEEFVIILPETDRTMAEKVAEKLRKIVESIEFLHKGEIVHITISFGITQVKPEDKSHEDVFSRVDQAMYDAKKGGRNRVVAK